jgi:hypothetical protein
MVLTVSVRKGEMMYVLKIEEVNLLYSKKIYLSDLIGQIYLNTKVDSQSAFNLE